MQCAVREVLRPTAGHVYFFDDDNTMDVELLQVIRRIRWFGAWPVGLIASSPYEVFHAA
jgi:hypothetical protein